jgi:hypothetical protein
MLVEALQEAGFAINATPKKRAQPHGSIKRAASSALPRSKVSDSRLRAWYKARVKECTKKGEQPSDADDWSAARAKFGEKVRRYQVRDLRARLAPAAWRKQGRRPKAAQIKAAENSAE